MSRHPEASRIDLTGRRVLVTGAGPRSLGLATATTLADWGADVTVTTRSGATGLDLPCHPLDLADRASVETFAGWYAAARGRLDVLVNNAGIHLDLRSRWSSPTLTADGHETHWRTNYLGTVHLTQVLLPLLRESSDARVVNVVSKLYSRGSNQALFEGVEPYDSWAAYGTSKLGLVHHAREIGRRHPGIRGYSLHPGEVYSHIADGGLASSPVIARLRRLLAPVERRVLMTTEEGAQTTIHCATADVPGGYYRGCAPGALRPGAEDDAVAARLWDETQAWLAEAP